MLRLDEEALVAAQRRAAPSVREDPPASPAFAKGTGMARTPSGSGGVMVSGGGAAATPAQEQEDAGGANPFSKILGRMSGEVTR